MSRASPFILSDGTRFSSETTSISCQVILPLQPVFNALRKASLAAKRAAYDWAAAAPFASQYSRSDRVNTRSVKRGVLVIVSRMR